MKKIVRGNDCTLRIPVKKMVDGELVAFALPACTDIVVNLVSSLRRYALTYEIDATEDHVINAHVKGGTMPLSPLALEVKGKLFGCDWRSNEYEQIQFVDNNASGDTEFDGSEDEGEPSVEMDTAIVVLAPTADLTLLIKQAEEAVAQCAESEERRKESEESRQANETDRQLAEQGRKESEERRLKNEESRTQAETLRTDNESSRQLAETRRSDNETRRQAAETQREKDMKAAVDEAIARAKVSVDYLPESGEIQITTWGS